MTVEVPEGGATHLHQPFDLREIVNRLNNLCGARRVRDGRLVRGVVEIDLCANDFGALLLLFRSVNLFSYDQDELQTYE